MKIYDHEWEEHPSLELVKIPNTNVWTTPEWAMRNPQAGYSPWTREDLQEMIDMHNRLKPQVIKRLSLKEFYEDSRD